MPDGYTLLIYSAATFNPHNNPKRWTLPILQTKHWGSGREVSCPAWSSHVGFSWLQVPAPLPVTTLASCCFHLTKGFTCIVLHPPHNLWDSGAGLFIPILPIRKWKLTDLYAITLLSCAALPLASDQISASDNIPAVTVQIVWDTFPVFKVFGGSDLLSHEKFWLTNLAKWHQIHLTELNSMSLSLMWFMRPLGVLKTCGFINS